MKGAGDTLRRFKSLLSGGVHKNMKLTYYLRGASLMLTPKFLCRKNAERIMHYYDCLSEPERKRVDDRVAYYCHLPEPLDSHAVMHKLGDNRLKKPRLVRQSVYFFDSFEFTRCFDQSLRWEIRGGDVNTQVDVPAITKSRPVLSLTGGCSNNVLLKMDKVRHYIFLNDPFRWEEKETRIIFRGVVGSKQNRRRFIEMWKDNSLCDLEDTYTGMSLYDHLKFRYIMTLEGNDVASNLKWVMSSNSIAVMPRPTCETWFMEGRLIPNVHYIEIADDYHDLMERIGYYEEHPEEAKRIIQNAHAWVCEFQDKKREKLISLLVMKNYLDSVN